MNQLRQWVEAFTAREGRSPTDQEAMEGRGLSAADLRILRSAAAVRQVGSLDALMGDGEGDTFLSTVEAPMAPAGAATMRRDLALEALKPWPELVEILDRRLGGQSYGEIAQAIGITRKTAEILADRAEALVKRLVAADQQEQPVSLRLAVEI
jgi:DNA-directed RNA polymerase specialized sigma24 family protein